MLAPKARLMSHLLSSEMKTSLKIKGEKAIRMLSECLSMFSASYLVFIWMPWLFLTYSKGRKWIMISYLIWNRLPRARWKACLITPLKPWRVVSMLAPCSVILTIRDAWRWMSTPQSEAYWKEKLAQTATDLYPSLSQQDLVLVGYISPRSLLQPSYI